MNTKRVFIAFVTLLISLSTACSFFTGLFGGGGTSGSAPLVAKGNGPAGLTAEATSADSVKLTWQAVDGATSYHIAVSINGGETSPVIDLAPSMTSYEDFLAMPGSQLKYAVEALSASGSIGQSVVDVTTPERKPNPLKVDAQLDTEKIMTGTIGPEGGSISLTDRKGVQYRLDIPVGALEIPTAISITAVKKIDGWPLDGDMLGAVKIEPDGLILNDVATVTITPPQLPPSNNLLNLGFGFTGNGDEFHLQSTFDQKPGTSSAPNVSGGGHLSSLAKQSGASIVMETLVMYGIGIGQGTAENVGNLVRNYSPSSASSSWAQKKEAFITTVKSLVGLPTNPDEIILEDDLRNIQNTIDDAQDCRDVRSVIGSVGGWLWEANHKKYDPARIQRGHDKMVKELADKIKQVIDDEADKCKKQSGGSTNTSPSGTGCAEGLIRSVSAGSTQLFKDIQQQMLKDHGTNALTDPDAELIKCGKSYSVNAAVPSGSVEGVICDLNAPFTLAMTGDASGTLTFTPGSSTSGALTEVADGGGVTFDGGGSYDISGLDSNAPMMKIQFAETAHTPMGDFTHNESANLPMFQIKPGDVAQCP